MRRIRSRAGPAVFDETKAMLELGDSELELLELGARDEAELLEEAVEAGTGAFAQAQRLAAPAVRRLLGQLARLAAARASGAGGLVAQSFPPPPRRGARAPE